MGEKHKAAGILVEGPSREEVRNRQSYDDHNYEPPGRPAKPDADPNTRKAVVAEVKNLLAEFPDPTARRDALLAHYGVDETPKLTTAQFMEAAKTLAAELETLGV